VARDCARRGATVAAESVVLSASTSESYTWLFKLLCNPGESVLVPQPSYPLFEHLTRLEGLHVAAYHLHYHGRWEIDVASAAAAPGSTRALLVVSPNNPTGSFLHQEDLQRLDEVCAARNLMLIGDEVFADFPLAEVPNARSVMDARAATVCSLGGLSKTVGLPQIKLGWIGFGGPSSKLEELMPAYELVADTFLSVSTPAQIALPHLLARGAGVRRQIQTRIARNLQHLQEAVRATPAVSLLPVEGGWSATLQVPSYRSEEALVIELLTADHVLVHPGYFFDFERESFVIISLLVEPSAFDRGVARLLTRATEPGAR
jgi:alanine-synthesizing transaminase